MLSLGDFVRSISSRDKPDDVGELEAAIARLEAEIADAEQALTVFVSVEETQRIVELLAGKRGELEALMAEWSEFSQFIEGNA